jgi:hypothetical protein
MRTLTNMALALGLAAGASALSLADSPASAQGFYIDAPGIHVHAGKRHHHRHFGYYRRYHPGYGAYAADPGHPYGYNYNYGDPRCGIPNYTIQGGVCKPYRGY